MPGWWLAWTDDVAEQVLGTKWQSRCMCYQFYYPVTCGPKGHGSSSISFTYIPISFQTDITGHSRAPIPTKEKVRTKEREQRKGKGNEFIPRRTRGRVELSHEELSMGETTIVGAVPS